MKHAKSDNYTLFWNYMMEQFILIIIENHLELIRFLTLPFVLLAVKELIKTHKNVHIVEKQ